MHQAHSLKWHYCLSYLSPKSADAALSAANLSVTLLLLFWIKK